MKARKHYFTDVQTLSDEELKALSTELEEAYCISGYDYEEWTDDEAEERHLEMSRELRRRWELANPEEAERLRKLTEPLMRWKLEQVANYIHGSYQRNGVKIGDTIEVKKPFKFFTV